MPTIDWNKKTWTKNFMTFARGRLSNQAENYGDQWGDPEEKQHLMTVKEKYLLPFVTPEWVALEVGSGGGRWTQYMTEFKHVHCVDLNQVMLDYLRERFKDLSNISYIRTSGSDLPGVADASVDFVFTYGTFVHCDLDIIEGYVKEFKRVMKPGAKAVLQFSDKRKKAAQENPGFADNDPQRMSELLRKYGFEIELTDDTTLNHSAVIVALLSAA